MFKLLLKKAKKTQCDIAKELNVSQQAVSAWCTRRSRPSFEQLEKLAQALNVSVQEIIDSFKK